MLQGLEALAAPSLKLGLPLAMQRLKRTEARRRDPQVRGSSQPLTHRRQAGLKTAGISVPEQEFGRGIGAQLAGQLSLQALGLQVIGATQQQPGGLSPGQGRQPAEVRGPQGCRGHIQQGIAIREGLRPLPIGTLLGQAMAEMKLKRQGAVQNRSEAAGVSRKQGRIADHRQGQGLAAAIGLPALQAPSALLLSLNTLGVKPLELLKERAAALKPAGGIAGIRNLGLAGTTTPPPPSRPRGEQGEPRRTEVARFPDADLESLDRLWLVYSRGRYGFSVQGRLLAACGGQWERLWPRLGWKREGLWTRYPAAFTWSQEAPEGHLPLVNQLRGVRLMDALLQHPALARRIQLAGAAGAG